MYTNSLQQNDATDNCSADKKEKEKNIYEKQNFQNASRNDSDDSTCFCCCLYRVYENGGSGTDDYQSEA